MSNVPGHWLLLQRVVRFGETDAAGVMHFHHLLRWCHEAWEESLEMYGLHLRDVFPNEIHRNENFETALPVVNCKADFLLPIVTGDQLDLILFPEKLDMGSFQIHTQFQREGKDVALGLIRHLAINAKTRQRCSLPEGISRWLEASTLNIGPRVI